MNAPHASSRLRRGAVWALAAVVLGLVFASWLRPDMVFTVVSQVWSCL